MQEDDLKSVKLVIAGRTFPIKVTSLEEATVKQLEEEINLKISEFQSMYPSRDKLDCVIMTLLTYTYDQQKSYPTTTTDKPILDKLDEIKQTLASMDVA